MTFTSIIPPRVLKKAIHYLEVSKARFYVKKCMQIFERQHSCTELQQLCIATAARSISICVFLYVYVKFIFSSKLYLYNCRSKTTKIV